MRVNRLCRASRTNGVKTVARGATERLRGTDPEGLRASGEEEGGGMRASGEEGDREGERESWVEWGVDRGGDASE